MRNVSGKFLEKFEINFTFIKFFPKVIPFIEIMLQKSIALDRARMAI